MIATHHHKRVKQLILVMLGILLIFLSQTDPKSLPVILLITPVLLLFFIMSFTFYLLLNWSYKEEGFSRKNVLYSLVSSGVISLGLLLRSVNQLNGRDILLGVIFLIIASFYAKRLKLTTS